MFRRLLFVLLCIGLSLQGEAARAWPASHCPMEASMQAAPVPGDQDPTDAADCCNDLQDVAATGHLCKSGADCQTPVLAVVAAAGTVPSLSATASAGASAAPARAAPLATPWRPPERI